MKNFMRYAKHGLRLKFYNVEDNGSTTFNFTPQQINKFHYWLGEIKHTGLRYEVLSVRGKLMEQG